MAKGFDTLPGFRDFYPESCAVRNAIFDTWRSVAQRYGFVEYDGPVLEPTGLYTRKSGAEIVNQLFCFTDKGEREVALRPELTPTLARLAAARQREYKKPLRWFSIGQFFRYEKQQKGRTREFYQLNCDILGETSPAADAELIALSIDVMRAFGFDETHFRIRLSDRRVWTDFAARAGVGEASVGDFLQIIDKLDRDKPEVSAEKLAALGIAFEDVQAFIAAGDPQSESLGIVRADLAARGLERFVEIDLGIVRGLAYYTGAVFEVFDIGKGMRAVAGGGRYDKLVELIGGVDMAAAGFAMGDVVIGDLIRETPATAARLDAAVAAQSGLDLFIIVADETKRPEALRMVQELRDTGFRVASPIAPAKVGKQFQMAEELRAHIAVVIGAEYPLVTLKNLPLRLETICRREDFDAELTRLLGGAVG